jgi:Ca-activated chloride channel family protein
MRFAYPYLLWLLLVIPPALLAFLWWAARKRQRLLMQFIQFRLLPGLTVGLSPEREQLRIVLLLGAVVALIFALAGPQWGFTLEEAHHKGLNIVVAIDTSKSMLAEDITPNRLARAKLAAIDLMQTAKSDRLGLVAFAGSAFLQCPLTIDDAAFRQSVDILDVNTLPQGGTAIAEAITAAQAAFKKEDGHKVLVLFTDGEDHDSHAVEAARKAAEDGMRIFTIGVGSPEGESLRIRDSKGRIDFVRDSEGKVVTSRLNEPMLEEIAAVGEGFYLPLRGAKVIETLYKNGLEPLPKTESESKTYKRYHERFHWPLGIAMILLVLEILLPNRARTKPVAPTEGLSATKTAAMLAATLLLFPVAVNASPRTAMKAYQAGKYTEAQKEYERLIAADKKSDLRLVFNAGAAAYQATNYTAAINHFNTALASQDVKLQQAACFNLGNCQFRLGQEAKDINGMEAKWQEALKYFQNAVMLNPADQDAAHNLAFTKWCLEQIAALREAARQAKAAADAASRQRQYHQALQIMQQLVQSNPTAKQFEDFVKKLKDIDDIATPQQP